MTMTTVLVVEDEEHLRATLAYNLRKVGYVVETAASGPEATVRFLAAHPDLVLLDHAAWVRWLRGVSSHSPDIERAYTYADGADGRD